MNVGHAKESSPSTAQIDKELAIIGLSLRELHAIRERYARGRCKGVKSTKSMVMHAINDVMDEMKLRARELESAKV